MDTTTDRFMLDTSKGDDPLILLCFARVQADGEFKFNREILLDNHLTIMETYKGKPRKLRKCLNEYVEQFDDMRKDYDLLIENISAVLNLEHLKYLIR
jgi:hypothetical protein